MIRYIKYSVFLPWKPWLVEIDYKPWKMDKASSAH